RGCSMSRPSLLQRMAVAWKKGGCTTASRGSRLPGCLDTQRRDGVRPDLWASNVAVDGGAKRTGADLAQEIELKLELTPEAAGTLLAADLSFGAVTTVRQRSIYFDTPAQDLRAAGFSLRIRERGAQRIQTVKAADSGAAGLFARPEW